MNQDEEIMLAIKYGIIYPMTNRFHLIPDDKMTKDLLKKWGPELSGLMNKILNAKPVELSEEDVIKILKVFEIW
jgi:hypothetical protein